MEDRTFYNEVITDHNLHPLHKSDMDSPDIVLEGVNPSCGDEILLMRKVNDGVISDASYSGDGCAVSQASADIGIDMIIGRELSEARRLCGLFMKMIKSEATEEEIEELEEAGALENISRMPARVKCAVLSWRTLDEAIAGKE